MCCHRYLTIAGSEYKPLICVTMRVCDRTVKTRTRVDPVVATFCVEGGEGDLGLRPAAAARQLPGAVVVGGVCACHAERGGARRTGACEIGLMSLACGLLVQACAVIATIASRTLARVVHATAVAQSIFHRLARATHHVVRTDSIP